jgi:hypothetical protein
MNLCSENRTTLRFCDRARKLPPNAGIGGPPPLGLGLEPTALAMRTVTAVPAGRVTCLLANISDVAVGVFRYLWCHWGFSFPLAMGSLIA